FQAQHAAGPSSDDAGVELLLLDVLYDHLRVETALSALQDGHGRRFLPLRQFGNVLGFRLHVEPVKRVASGFLGDPEDRVALNGFTGRCVRKGKVTLFDSSLCFERDNELYLSADLMTRLMGLHFTWRMNRLELEVTSDTPLPIQQQWMQRQMLDRQGEPPVLSHLPLVRSPYSLWTLPSLDMQWYTDAAVQDKVTQSASRLQIQGRGDLLYMSAQYRYVSASGDEPAATLLSLGREDPHGGLLGPLRATQISFGDLNLAQVPLFARARNGLGAAISNFPPGGLQAGAPTQLEGHAPVHSIVELYRGNELLTTVRTDDQGRYLFPAVPLESGPNDLRLVLITPDGEIQEEQRTLYGDATGPEAGQSQYRLTAARVGDSIFPRALTGISQEQKRLEYVGEYRWGLSESSWLAATAANSQGENFLGLGLHSWGGDSLWHLQTMLSGNGGSALSAGISRKMGGATLSLEHTLASRNFATALIPEIGSDATSMTRLRLDGSTGDHRRPIGYGLSIDRMDGASPATLLRTRLNYGDGHAFYANTIAMRMTSGPIDATGLLQVRKPFGFSVGRLDVGYGFGIEKPLQTLQLSLDRGISANYRVRYGLDYDVSRAARLEGVGAIYRVLGPLELGLNLALDAKGALKANLLLSVGMEGADAFRTMALARPGSVDTGSVAVRVYLDRNYDGKFDDGDTPLANIGLKVAGRPAIIRTGKDGTCFIDRLESNQEVTIALNEDTFEDPGWAPASPGVLVIPRTGHLVHLDFGVIEAAEIDGRALGVDNLRSGLTAEMIDSLGKVAQTSVLDSDSTFVFSQVRPGDYTLRLVDPAGFACGGRLVHVTPGAMMKSCDVKFVAPKQP
ncbi:MAG: hypothetical protein ACHQ50_10730, partial [Fimbriimonadales bacterium]